MGIGYSGIVAATGKPLFARACPNDPRNVYTDQDRELGLITYLGLPIMIRGEILGVLPFNTEEPRQYSPEQIAYLSSFANMAAIAIENARLFQQVSRGKAEWERTFDSIPDHPGQAARGERPRTGPDKAAGRTARRRIWAESEGKGKGSTFTVLLPFGDPGR